MCVLSDAKVKKTNFPSVKIDMLVTPQPGFVLTWLNLHQLYTFSSPLSPDICSSVQGQKKRCYLYADLILNTVYVEVGTKLSVCVV